MAAALVLIGGLGVSSFGFLGAGVGVANAQSGNGNSSLCSDWRQQGFKNRGQCVSAHNHGNGSGYGGGNGGNAGGSIGQIGQVIQKVLDSFVHLAIALFSMFFRF